MLFEGTPDWDGTPVSDDWFWRWPYNFALEHDGGCIPFVHSWDELWPVYDIHFLFPPEVRGIRAVNSARAMLAEAFTNYGAARITGTISRSHRAARWFIRQIGFVPVGTGERGGKPVVHYALDRKAWLGSQPERPPL